MASAIGQTIGKCFYIYGGHNDSPVVFAQPRMLAKSAALDSANSAAAPEEVLEFNEIKVSARVVARFVLE